MPDPITYHALLARHDVTEDGLLELIADAVRCHNFALERAAKAALALAKEYADALNEDDKK